MVKFLGVFPLKKEERKKKKSPKIPKFNGSLKPWP